MARTPRRDAPGQIHHIMNRAARRQVLFADRQDYRYFMALLARSVKRGELVIHAYCLLGTHFHLLAASPDGRISYAMMRIQNAYARYRNRRSKQDGSLFRGRFRSKPVLSRLYWWTLMRYIDHNPVLAGLCTHPFEYPYGSAQAFAGPKGPRWLDRAGVAAALRERTGQVDTMGRAYARVLGAPLSQATFDVIEERLAQPGIVDDDLDRLFRAPPAYLAKWMARKIRAAGGRSPWIPIAAASAVLSTLAAMRVGSEGWTLRCGRNRLQGWPILAAGLLHGLACLSADRVAVCSDCHAATAARRIRRHKELMLSDRAYAQRAGRVARAALDATFPN